MTGVPVVTSSHEKSWSAHEEGLTVTGLVNPGPKSLKVVGSCQGGRSVEAALEADNWSIKLDSSTLSFEVRDASDQRLLVNLPNECIFDLNYRLETQSASVSLTDQNGEEFFVADTAVLNEPLHLGKFVVSFAGESPFIAVSAESSHGLIEKNVLRSVGFLLVVISISILLARVLWTDLLLLAKSMRGASLSSLFGARNWVHVSLLLGLLSIAILAPSHFDDGWIFHRATITSPAEQIRDPYLWGVLVLQGVWLERLLSFFVERGFTFLFLKFLLSLVLWVGWLALSSAMRKAGLVSSTERLLILASVFGAFSAAFLLTMRPESVVALMVAIFFSFFILFVVKNRHSYLLYAAFAAVIAVATHPTGFILIGPAILAAIFAIRVGLQEGTGLSAVITISSAALILGLGLVFLEFDFRTALREARAITALDGYVQPEWSRWELLSSQSSFLWWPIAVMAFSLIVALSRYREFTSQERWIFLAVVLTPLGLFLSPSKWDTHLGTLVVPAVVATALALPILVRAGRANPFEFSAFLGMAGVATLIALNSGGKRHWGYPFEPLQDGLVDRIVPGSGIGMLWLAVPLLPLGALIVARLRNGLRGTVIAVLSALMVLAPSLNHFGMLAANSIGHSGWTPAKQRLAELEGTNTCGLLDDVEVIVDVSTTAEDAQPSGASAPGPFGLKSHSLDQPGESIAFSLNPPREELVFWIKGTERNTSVLVELSNTEGQTRFLNVTELDDEMWRLVAIPRASRWEYIEVWSLPNARGRTGVLVSTPAEPVRVTALDALAESTVFSGPIVNTYIPCANEPGVVDGVWEMSDYLFRNDWGWPIGSEGVYGDFVEVAYRDGVRGSFISLVKVVK